MSKKFLVAIGCVFGFSVPSVCARQATVDSASPAFREVLEAVPIYSVGSLPNVSLTLANEGRVKNLSVIVYKQIPIEAVFDVVAGTLTNAPLPLPDRTVLKEAHRVDGRQLSSAELQEVNTSLQHKLFFRFSESADPSVNAQAASDVRKLNTRVRGEYLAIHVQSNSKGFLFNAIPVSVLDRYPGVMKPEEVYSLENLRFIDKSFFNFPEYELAEARKNPEWNQFFNRLEHPEFPSAENRAQYTANITPDGLQRAFLTEKLRRDSNEIIENAQFRSLCSNWADFFTSHASATKEELLAKRDELDRQHHEMLKK